MGRLSVHSWSTTWVRRALRGRGTTLGSALALVMATGTVVVARGRRRRLPEPRGPAQRRRRLGHQQHRRLLRPRQQADRPDGRRPLRRARGRPRRRPGRRHRARRSTAAAARSPRSTRRPSSTPRATSPASRAAPTWTRRAGHPRGDRPRRRRDLGGRRPTPSPARSRSLGLDREAQPLHEAGGSASMAVSRSGDVLVVSADEGTLTELDRSGPGFGVAGDHRRYPTTSTPPPGSPPSARRRCCSTPTTAGVWAPGRGARSSRPPRIDLPVDGVLQQSRPGAADAALVATPDALLSVPLAAASRPCSPTASPVGPRRRSASAPASTARGPAVAARS